MKEVRDDKRTVVMFIGGFLGAGKTTLVRALVRHLTATGERVAVVTNDQASGLVDTESLRPEAVGIGEVAGGCFCCKYSTLDQVLERLTAEKQPTVILAEAVGSCTDQQATVLAPLERFRGDRYQIPPLLVVTDPYRVLRVLSSGSTVSENVAHLYVTQLAEAGVIAINKIDAAPPSVIAEAEALIRLRFPDVPVVKVSALDGTGVAALLEGLVSGEVSGVPATKRIADVDYERYAAGEMEMAWLNAELEFTHSGGAEGTAKQDRRLDFDLLATLLVQIIGSELATAGCEPAHLKAMVKAPGQPASIANQVSVNSAPVLSVAGATKAQRAEVVINARVFGMPEHLQAAVGTAVAAVASRLGAEVAVRATRCFQPSRPVPEYRFTDTALSKEA